MFPPSKSFLITRGEWSFTRQVLGSLVTNPSSVIPSGPGPSSRIEVSSSSKREQTRWFDRAGEATAIEPLGLLPAERSRIALAIKPSVPSPCKIHRNQRACRSRGRFTEPLIDGGLLQRRCLLDYSARRAAQGDIPEGFGAGRRVFNFEKGLP